MHGCSGAARASGRKTTNGSMNMSSKKRRTVYGQKYREELSDALWLLMCGLLAIYLFWLLERTP